MKKVYIILLTVLIAAAGAYLVLLNTLGPQRNLCLANPEASTGRMFLSQTPILVEMAPGVRFKLDTGSGVSTINPSDIEKLREAGINVSPVTLFAVDRDAYARYNFYTEGVRVDFPLYDYDFMTDSTGRAIPVGTPRKVNTLENVDFFVAPGISTLGIDVMQKMMVEYLYNEQALAFHNRRPKGYQETVELRRSLNPLYFFITGERYYMNVGVDHIYNDYYIDTGLQLAMLKLPSDQADRSGHTLREDSVRTLLNVHKALTDDRAWIELGHRAGYRRASYYDSEEPYGINPLNIFTQDMLLDFGGGMIYLRPYCVPNTVRNKSAAALRR